MYFYHHIKVEQYLLIYLSVIKPIFYERLRFPINPRISNEKAVINVSRIDGNIN